MKAAVYTRAGDPDVIHLEDREIPTPAAGEVRVRIQVSGVNPTDWKSRRNTEPTTFQVPGQDGAGIVDALGDGVTGFEIDDRVWVWDSAFQRPGGTSQEYISIPSAQVVALPDAASFELGASLGIPALTAHLALRAGDSTAEPLVAGALDGQFVLVAGGAGAVGHAAIELAVFAGAHVITTVSSDEKAALVTAAGAHTVINYRTEDVAARIAEVAPDGVDRIVEVNPNANAELDTRVAKPHSTIAIYATDESTPMPLIVNPSMRKNLTYRFILTYTSGAEEKAAAVAGVAHAVGAGTLHVGEEHGLPVTFFDLADTAAAHAAVENAAVGKVLIRVAAS